MAIIATVWPIPAGEPGPQQLAADAALAADDPAVIGVQEPDEGNLVGVGALDDRADRVIARRARRLAGTCRSWKR